MATCLLNNQNTPIMVHLTLIYNPEKSTTLTPKAQLKACKGGNKLLLSLKITSQGLDLNRQKMILVEFCIQFCSLFHPEKY